MYKPFGDDGHPNLMLLRCIEHEGTSAQGRHGNADGLLLLGGGRGERDKKKRDREPGCRWRCHRETVYTRKVRREALVCYYRQ